MLRQLAIAEYEKNVLQGEISNRERQEKEDADIRAKAELMAKDLFPGMNIVYDPESKRVIVDDVALIYKPYKPSYNGYSESERFTVLICDKCGVTNGDIYRGSSDVVATVGGILKHQIEHPHECPKVESDDDIHFEPIPDPPKVQTPGEKLIDAIRGIVREEMSYSAQYQYSLENE
jgi:hypothetical protein